jgi:ATP-binding cassette subfamily B protein
LLDELTKGSRASSTRSVQLALAAMALGALASAASYVAGYLSSHVQQATMRLAEDRLYSHVNRFVGLRYLEDASFHDQLRLAERAAESAPNDLTVFLIGLVRQISGVGAYLGVLLGLWPPMAVLLAAAALPALLAQLTLARQGERAVTVAMTSQRWRYYYRSLLTDPDAAKEIRIFGLGPLFHRRMMAAFQQALDAELPQNRRVTMTEVAFSLLNAAVSAVGAVVVVRAVISGRLTIGDFSLFLTAIATVQAAFSAVVLQFGRATIGLRLFATYVEILRTPSDLPEGVADAPSLRHGVEFHDVWFRYHNDAPWVLQGVTFEVVPGQAVGLVGCQRRREDDAREVALAHVRPATRAHHLGRDRPEGSGRCGATPAGTNHLPGLRRL